MFSQSLIATVALGLLSTANAHLYMNSPTPISGTAPKDPLEADGSNFPCHGASYITGQGGQAMAAGTSQSLSFDTGAGANWAVHGGGSCQISITYETDAAKVKDPSNWKVIYSVMGGCPSNTFQNLNGNYQGPSGSYTGAYPCSDPRTNGVDCVNTFNYTIPEALKNGKATLAWTWFNTVGNREMYMNCADVTISGAQDDDSGLAALPDLFVANLASVNSCPTTQSVDVIFPNPGTQVLTKTAEGSAAATASTYPLALPTGSGCGSATGGSGTSPTTKASASKSAYATPTATSAAGGFIGTTTKAAATNGGGIFAPGASSAAQASANGGATTSFVTVVATKTGAVSSIPVAATSAAAAPVSTGVSGSDSSNSSSGSCTNGAVACSNDGGVVCMANNKWGLCDRGCAVPQLMADGMSCDAGVMKASSRVMRRNHFHGKVHRRFI